MIFWGLRSVVATAVNAKLSFASANIESSAFWLLDDANVAPTVTKPIIINKTFRISTTYLVSMPTPNVAAVSCTVNAATGEVSGKLTLKDGTVPRSISYYTIVLSDHQRARGWFTLPQLPVTTVESGVVEFLSGP